MLVFSLKRVIFICEGIYNYYITHNQIQRNKNKFTSLNVTFVFHVFYFFPLSFQLENFFDLDCYSKNRSFEFK